MKISVQIQHPKHHRGFMIHVPIKNLPKNEMIEGLLSGNLLTVVIQQKSGYIITYTKED